MDVRNLSKIFQQQNLKLADFISFLSSVIWNDTFILIPNDFIKTNFKKKKKIAILLLPSILSHVKVVHQTVYKFMKK